MAILAKYGDRGDTDAGSGMVAVLRAQDPADPDGTIAAAGGSTRARHDRPCAATARLWAAHFLENAGDPERALEEPTRGLALVRTTDGPWSGR